MSHVSILERDHAWHGGKKKNTSKFTVKYFAESKYNKSKNKISEVSFLLNVAQKNCFKIALNRTLAFSDKPWIRTSKLKIIKKRRKSNK